MVHISPYKLSKERYEKIFLLFYEVVGKQKKEMFDRILFELLSPDERIMIAKRIAIIYLLMQDINYSVIGKVLGVSSTTVFKYRLLSENSNGVVPVLKKILLTEKVFSIFEEIMSDIFSPGVYGVNWSNAWRRKFALERKKVHGM